MRHNTKPAFSISYYPPIDKGKMQNAFIKILDFEFDEHTTISEVLDLMPLFLQIRFLSYRSKREPDIECPDEKVLMLAFKNATFFRRHYHQAVELYFWLNGKEFPREEYEYWDMD